jgi:hypothetical protein
MITKSHLATIPSGFTARVQPSESVSFAELVDLVARFNTTVTKSDVLGVLEDYHQVVEEQVAKGRNVITPHVLYHATIRGVFENDVDGFDPSRHQVVIRVSPAKRLRRAMRDVPVEKVPADKPKPRPLTCLDLVSGAENGTLTPGGDVRLLGSDLRYDPADPQQGVFFINTAGTETRVETVSLNMPGQLIFRAPALPAGTYQLQVRAILHNSQDLRTGVLDAVLTVA